jgi:hypothetical protein
LADHNKTFGPAKIVSAWIQSIVETFLRILGYIFIFTTETVCTHIYCTVGY